MLLYVLALLFGLCPETFAEMFEVRSFLSVADMLLKDAWMCEDGRSGVLGGGKACSNLCLFPVSLMVPRAPVGCALLTLSRSCGPFSGSLWL